MDFRITVLAMGVAGLLSGCPGSDSGNTAPALAFDQGGVAVKRGSTRQVVLSLNNGSAAGQSVRVAASDASIAEVTPASCTLSGSSDASSRCTLTLRGKSNGTATVVAQSPGYVDASLSATVSDSITYGALAVADATGTFVTTSPVSVTFKATGPTPYQKTLKAQISGSSGIDASAGAYINFTGSTGVTFNPQQCQVTSASPECDTVASIPAATAATVTVQVVGAVLANNPGYSSIAVNATPNSTPTFGDIVLSTQSGNNVPNGMKAPLFVNWNNPSQSDTVTVTLDIVGTGVSFYSYAPGTNVNITTSQSQTCVLSYSGSGSAPSCGFGLVGQAASGSVTVNATATATSQHAYKIASLTLGAVVPEATRRSVTFNNTSAQTVYVGITGGAAASYIGPTTPAVPAGMPSANVKPGAGSTCGPSNPQAACPIGSTCLQGGSAPSTNISDTPFYCYYDQPTPTAGYELAAATGSTVLNISGSSLSPGGVIWSGNFYARTGCDSTTGICENATCVGAAGGLACGPGTGPSPGVNTLAETTMQAYSSSDYYDVSIINGLNFATQFGPTNVAISSSDAYTCGVAGSASAQNGGYPANPTAGLPAAPWTLNPTASASFPPGVTVDGDPLSYYQVVAPSGRTELCTSSSSCTLRPPNSACGYRMSDLVGGNFSFASNARTCGRPVAFLTADSIWSANSTPSNAAPFAFATKWPNGLTPPGTVSVGDLQLCINGTYSAYVGNGTATSVPPFPVQPLPLACGGVMWGATESPGPLQNPSGNVGLGITRPAQPVQTANENWLSYILPTIKWLKQACPTCYTYPFDDMTSTFTCVDNSRNPSTNYGITFSDLLVN